MTRKELTAIVLEANPQFSRYERTVVRITSPLTFRIGQRVAKKQMKLMCEALAQQDTNLLK